MTYSYLQIGKITFRAHNISNGMPSKRKISFKTPCHKLPTAAGPNNQRSRVRKGKDILS